MLCKLCRKVVLFEKVLKKEIGDTSILLMPVYVF